MDQKVFIGIGSNIGNPINNCLTGIKKIKEDKRVIFLSQSSLYSTSPVSDISQDDFINCVISIYWSSSPSELLNFLQKIEKDMGRQRGLRNGPRIIDMDILFYADIVSDVPALKIPHPEAHKRKFVIIPCIEIDPDLIHPVFNKRLSDFLSDIGDEQKITVRR